MKKSKFLRIAKAGATTDGRNIERKWIEEMAASYNPKTYSARISIEHIKGLHPNSEFRNYGDVLALKTEEENGDLYLLAQLAPTDELIEFTKKGQKNFTSIEVNPNFADTGKAYLVGLAVTDNPASLGTDYLKFCAQNQALNVFTQRKANPDNLVTELIELGLNAEELEEIAPAENPAFNAIAFNQLKSEVQNLKEQVAEYKSQVADVQAKLDKLENLPAPSYKKRPWATGETIQDGYF